MSRYNAALQKEVNVEIVSAALFGRARDLGVAPTRRWIEDQLDRLRSHGPACRCNEPCQLAAGATASKVHWVCRCWTLSTAATERLARR